MVGVGGVGGVGGVPAKYVRLLAVNSPMKESVAVYEPDGLVLTSPWVYFRLIERSHSAGQYALGFDDRLVCEDADTGTLVLGPQGDYFANAAVFSFTPVPEEEDLVTISVGGRKLGLADDGEIKRLVVGVDQAEHWILLTQFDGVFQCVAQSNKPSPIYRVLFPEEADRTAAEQLRKKKPGYAWRPTLPVRMLGPVERALKEELLVKTRNEVDLRNKLAELEGKLHGNDISRNMQRTIDANIERLKASLHAATTREKQHVVTIEQLKKTVSEKEAQLSQYAAQHQRLVQHTTAADRREKARLLANEQECAALSQRLTDAERTILLLESTVRTLRAFKAKIMAANQLLLQPVTVAPQSPAPALQPPVSPCSASQASPVAQTPASAPPSAHKDAVSEPGWDTPVSHAMVVVEQREGGNEMEPDRSRDEKEHEPMQEQEDAHFATPQEDEDDDEQQDEDQRDGVEEENEEDDEQEVMHSEDMHTAEDEDEEQDMELDQEESEEEEQEQDENQEEEMNPKQELVSPQKMNQDKDEDADGEEEGDEDEDDDEDEDENEDEDEDENEDEDEDVFRERSPNDSKDPPEQQLPNLGHVETPLDSCACPGLPTMPPPVRTLLEPIPPVPFPESPMLAPAHVVLISETPRGLQSESSTPLHVRRSHAAAKAPPRYSNGSALAAQTASQYPRSVSVADAAASGRHSVRASGAVAPARLSLSGEVHLSPPYPVTGRRNLSAPETGTIDLTEADGPSAGMCVLELLTGSCLFGGECNMTHGNNLRLLREVLTDTDKNRITWLSLQRQRICYPEIMELLDHWRAIAETMPNVEQVQDCLVQVSALAAIVDGLQQAIAQASGTAIAELSLSE